MSAARDSWQVGLRMVRATPGRTAVIGLTIAVPAAIATVAVMNGSVGAFWLAVGSIVVTAAVVIVAQSSAEPTMTASTIGWRAAGASEFTAGLPRRHSLRIIGWAAVAVGGGLGVVVGASVGEATAPGTVAVLLIGLALTVFACAAVRWSSRPPRWLTVRPGDRVAGALLLVAVGLGMIGVAAVLGMSVSTDWDAGLTIPLCAALLSGGLLVMFGPVRTGVLVACGRAALVRPAAVLARRHRGRLLVRAVAIASFVVAGVASVFGSSVAAREQQVPDAESELNALPRVPANVMALTLPFDRLTMMTSLPPPTPPSFASDTISLLEAQFPDSTVVPVEEVVGESTTTAWFYCILGRCQPPVVADPRLDAVYGQVRQRENAIALNVEGRDVIGHHSAPSEDALVKDRLDGGPLPLATFHDLNTVQVDPFEVRGTGLPTVVSTVFLTRPTPYSEEERHRLDQMAVTATAVGGTAVATAVNASSTSTDFARGGYGDAPWAPVEPAKRWSITLLAATLALIVVVGTSSVDAMDRWRDNQRLEVLGASARQVRAGAVLHTWIELGLVAVLSVGGAAGLLALGITEFNTDATYRVPLVLPWTQLIVLAVVVPLIGMTIAGLVARPLRRGSFAGARQPVRGELAAS